MKNKNLKKVLSLSLCAAMAMTAVPVAGSFVNPAVVRAADAEDMVMKATAEVVFDNGDDDYMVEVTVPGLEDGVKGGYRYVWAQDAAAGEKMITGEATGGEGISSVTEYKFKIALPDDYKKNVLVIKKVASSMPDSAVYKSFTFKTQPDIKDGEITVDKDFNFVFEKNKYQVKEAGGNNWADTNPDQATYASGAKNDGVEKSFAFRKRAMEGDQFPSAPKTMSVKRLKMADLDYSFKMTPEGKVVVTPGDTIKAVKDVADEVLYKLGNKEGTLSRTEDTVFENLRAADVLQVYVADVEEDDRYKVTIQEADAFDSTNVKIENGKITGLTANRTYVRHGNTAYEVVTEADYDLKSQYDEYEILTMDEATNLTVKPDSGNKEKILKLPSASVTRLFKNPNLVIENIAAAPSTGTTVTPADTTKPEGSKKDETKPADTTKPEEPKKEETKPAETPAAPVIERVVNRAEAKAQIGSEAVEKIMTNGTGKVTTIIKGVAVKFDGTTLKAALGNKAEAITVSMKSGKPSKVETKAVKKYAKKNKVLVNKVYNLSVMLGEKSVNNFDLGKNTMEVVLFKKFKKAPKNLYVLNVETGKMMKAVYEEKTGKIRFNAGKAGKYVLVEKK